VPTPQHLDAADAVQMFIEILETLGFIAVGIGFVLSIILYQIWLRRPKQWRQLMRRNRGETSERALRAESARTDQDQESQQLTTAEHQILELWSAVSTKRYDLTIQDSVSCAERPGNFRCKIPK